MVVIFFTALLIGDGGLFLLVWNASVWGTIFAILAKAASSVAGKNPFIYFILILLTVLPHMLLEAMSYFSAAGSGSIISQAFMREKLVSDKFVVVTLHSLWLLLLGLAFVIIGAYVETYVLFHAETYRLIISQSFG